MARLRAELTAALSMGGGGQHVDVTALVMGHRPGEEAGGSGSGAVGRSSVMPIGRSVFMQQSPLAGRSSTIGAWLGGGSTEGRGGAPARE